MNNIVTQLREHLTDENGKLIRGGLSRCAESVGVTVSTVRNWYRGYDGYGAPCAPSPRYRLGIKLFCNSKRPVRAFKTGRKTTAKKI